MKTAEEVLNLIRQNDHATGVHLIKEYARQVGEAVRENCAKVTDSVPEPSGADTGEMWRKAAANSLGEVIRVLPVKAP